MAMTRSELLAPLIAERDRIKTLPTRDKAARERLRLLKATINEIRGKANQDDADLSEELEDIYAELRAIEDGDSWDDDATAAWGSGIVRLIQAANAGDLLVDHTGPKDPTPKRVQAMIRRYAKGEVAHAPESIVERAHDLGEQHFDMVVDGRPSESAYALHTIDENTSADDLARICAEAKTIGQRIEARRARRDSE